MTWQAVIRSALAIKVPAKQRPGLLGGIGYLERTQRLQKVTRIFQMKARIAGLDRQEEAIAARARECLYVEHRVIRLRGPGPGQQSDPGGQRAAPGRPLATPGG